MELFESYIPQDRRVALAQGIPLPESAVGSILFADISGFTPLTEAMTHSLGVRRGAEELTRQLNQVYDAILAPVEQYGGAVITFSGDAALCFFSTGPRAALACALAMQAAMQQFAAVPLPDGTTARIALKVSITTGTVRRMVVGDPAIRQMDAIAGAPVTRSAIGEHFSSPGEIWIDEPTADSLGDTLPRLTWQTEPQTHERYGLVDASTVPPLDVLPPGEAALLSSAQARPWLHPHVYDWLDAQQEDFLTELRPVVALFARFTGLDFDRDPAVSGKFNQFIVRVQALLARYQGTLLELTVGDKGSYFYAIFGAPNVHEDDAQRAIHAGHELLDLPAELGFIEPLQIGISQGTMRVGAYGSRTRRTYGAQGDEVNLAARLMMQAAPGEVLVSGRIQKAVAEEFDFEPQPPILLKGKAEPLLSFIVKGARTARTARLQESSYSLPMIGREPELDQIRALLAAARRGNGQIVGITAPAGLGKSRLVGEVIRLARRGGDESYRGECQSFGSNSSYLVWSVIWREFFGIEANAPARRLARALQGELEDLAPDRLDALPLLGAALHLPLPDNSFTATLEPEYRKSALEALLGECLGSAAEQARAQGHVLLFVLEDAHWIDPASRDLLERLAERVATLPILLLLTYRPSEANAGDTFPPPGLGARENFTEIVLQDLSPAQGEGLIRAKLAQLAPENTAAIPPALIAQITQRAQGNPFYIEELLNYMHDRGLNLRDPAALARADLPNSLHRLILSRIDHLSEQAQLTLKVASVLGRTFLLAHLAGYYPRLGAPTQVQVETDRLQQLNLVQAEPAAPELTYLFKHIVTRQVAYESLAYGTRRMLHEAYAQFLEAHFDVNQNLDLLAYHYDQSANESKRREYLHRAGEAAAARYANVEALDYLSRALAIAPPTDLVERCELLSIRERVLDVQGERELQKSDLTALEQLAVALDEPELRARALLRRATLAERTGAYAQAVGFLQEFFAFVEASGIGSPTREQLLSEGYALRAQVLSAQGNAADARPHAEQALALARAGDDRGAEARALDRLGTLAEEYETARAYHTAAITLAHALGDRRREGIATNNLGTLEHLRGEYAQAIQIYEQALALVREIGDRASETLLLSNLASAHFTWGEADRALAVSAEALELAQAINDRRNICRIHLNLGESYRLLGAYPQALEHTQRALELARELDARFEQGIALGNFAALALEQDNAAQTLAYATDALALADAVGDREGKGIRLNLRGQAQFQLGDLTAAADSFRQALAVWQTLDPSSDILLSHAGLAQLARARGESDSALADIEPILTFLAQYPDRAGDSPALDAALAAYQVLAALDDPRAHPFLQQTLATLNNRAEKIKDLALRHSFLENVRTHRVLRAFSTAPA